MNWEIKNDIHELPLLKQLANWNLLYRTKSLLSLVLCDDLEEWDGMSWEGGARRWGYMYTEG